MVEEETEIDRVRNDTKMDLNVLYGFVNLIEKEDLYTIETVAMLKSIKQICLGMIRNISIVAGYKVAKMNKAVTDIIIQIEEEEAGEDDSQYYM